MVPVTSLWLPIVLSAVIVFVLSSVIHMFLTYHRSDIAKVPSEDEARAALGPLNIPPGEYMIPHAGSPAGMRDPAFQEKLKQGPVAFLTVLPSGPPAMSQNLLQWFVYCLVVGVFAAYVAGRALTPGVEYLAVFRFAGVTAFLGYTLALWQNSIWWKRSWSTTLKHTFDGLLYALFTAGVFGWLWPD